jgi:hypothetical protein
MRDFPEIMGGVQAAVAKTLCLDLDEVQPVQRFFTDLGAESIDWLELSFLLEKYGKRLPGLGNYAGIETQGRKIEGDKVSCAGRPFHGLDVGDSAGGAGCGVSLTRAGGSVVDGAGTGAEAGGPSVVAPAVGVSVNGSGLAAVDVVGGAAVAGGDEVAVPVAPAVGAVDGVVGGGGSVGVVAAVVGVDGEGTVGVFAATTSFGWSESGVESVTLVGVVPVLVMGAIVTLTAIGFGVALGLVKFRLLLRALVH